MATNAADWRTQWLGALAGARAGLDGYEQLARALGIDESNRPAAMQQLGIAIVQTSLVSGLPWTEHDNGATTLEQARTVLAIASHALDEIETQRNARH